MLQNCTILKVSRVFFSQPTKQHYLKEISITSGIAHTSVKRELEVLKKEEIIKEIVERKGSRKFPVFSANMESSRYKKYKQLNNIIHLYESGLVEYIRDKIMPSAIVLFGSYLKGDDIEDSDIDIFIESTEQKIDIMQYEKILGRKIQLHFIADFNRYPKELRSNIANGLVLQGHLEVYK